MNQAMLDNFVYFINERENVHHLKDELDVPGPWTDDKILQAFRFCNIRRESDRVTRWIARNWRVPHDGERTLPAAMLLARIINVPETLAHIGYPSKWNPFLFEEMIAERMRAGKKTWTSAYMVTGTESKGMTKAQYTALLMSRASHLELPTSSLHHASSALQGIKGISTFLAGQVIADLKYTSQWRNCPDWWDFAVPGPGSIRGLHRVHQRAYNTGMGEQQFAEELLALRGAVEGRIPVLHAQDVQNCLCEWDKYRRAVEGQGTPKQRYVKSLEQY